MDCDYCGRRVSAKTGDECDGCGAPVARRNDESALQSAKLQAEYQLALAQLQAKDLYGSGANWQHGLKQMYACQSFGWLGNGLANSIFHGLT